MHLNDSVDVLAPSKQDSVCVPTEMFGVLDVLEARVLPLPSNIQDIGFEHNSPATFNGAFEGFHFRVHISDAFATKVGVIDE